MKTGARLSSDPDQVCPLCEGTTAATGGSVFEALLGPACPVSASDWAVPPLQKTHSVVVSSGKVSSDVPAGNFCVNPSMWTHLFPHQHTGGFLTLGPHLLNSCIIETDYLRFPARHCALSGVTQGWPWRCG